MLALAVRDGRGPAPAAGALIRGRLGQLHHGSIDEDVNATATAVLALGRLRPRAVARAARWLASIQGTDGGFGFRPGIAPDVDTTGLATWALAVAGRSADARRGGTFVRSAQAADGGFPSLPGGASNAQSTGLALVALRVSGVGPGIGSSPTPLDYLAGLARHDGSLEYATDRARPRSGPRPRHYWG